LALVVRGSESDVFHEADGIRLAQRLPARAPAIPRRATTRMTSSRNCAGFCAAITKAMA